MSLHDYYKIFGAIGIGLITGFIVTLIFRYYRHLKHPNPKTRIQWLTHLPKEYRHKAICYAYETGLHNRPARDLLDALANSFEWNKTKEGGQYWADVYLFKINRNEVQSERKGNSN